MKQKKPGSLSTDQLIDRLAGDLKPVQPVKLRASATVIWILAIFAMTGALVAMTGHLRADVLIGPMPARLILGVLGSILTVAAAGTGFVRLLVPGRPVPRPILFILGVGLLQMMWSIVAAGWTTAGWDLHSFAGLDVGGGVPCTAIQSVYAVVLAIPLIFGAKRYAPTKLLPLGLFIGFMAVAAGFGGLLVHCPSDDVVHLAVYHLLPAVVLSIGAGGLVAALVRW